ncbi:MAG: hypothetical protein J2P41_20355, partial [Blastocatellia bacterium]|nr:hypothetical protein [Blastocatellia bacterium]
IAATGKPQRPTIHCAHTQPKSFQPGEPLTITLNTADVSAIRLHYRHINQAERWQAIEMKRTSQGYSAAIPADYSKSPYGLQYYFELRRDPDIAWLYPGLDANLSNQPYYSIANA